MVEIKLEQEEGWKVLKMNNVVNIFNDVKDFCWLDLKCFVAFCFTVFCYIFIVLLIE